MHIKPDHYLFRKTFVIAVAFSGAVLNLLYGLDLCAAFVDLQHDEYLISAIALDLGWIALFILIMFKPFEARPILLLAIIPMLTGNLLHSFTHFDPAHGGTIPIMMNTIYGLLYAGLYVTAFKLGHNEPREQKTAPSETPQTAYMH